MNYLIDTNIFLRYLEASDEKSYEECLVLLRALKEGKINGVTSHLILSEIYWTLKTYYKFPKSKRIEVLENIYNLSGLNFVDGYNLVVALKSHKESKAKFIDCMLASIPKVLSKEWVIVSYDKDFKKLPIISKEPGEDIKLLVKSSP